MFWKRDEYPSSRPLFATRDFEHDLGIFFTTCFCLGWFPGLFSGDGLVIALSGCFRSLRIPLRIGVEYGVSGNRRLDSRLGLITADFPALRINRIQPRLTSTEDWWDCLAPRAGFEPATRSNYSSVARVTAVHTLGRLPQAADRAILPLRTPIFQE